MKLLFCIAAIVGFIIAGVLQLIPSTTGTVPIAIMMFSLAAGFISLLPLPLP